MVLFTLATGVVSYNFISSAALPERANLPHNLPPNEAFLGQEIDRCSGALSVRNKSNQWVPVPRGKWVVVDVAIDGNGYWYWKCGGSSEKSRGVPNYRQRVKRLKIQHSVNDRKITWQCFDLL